MIKLKVPHFEQAGLNCWWFALQMIRAYHDGLPEDEWVVRQLEILGDLPTTQGISPGDRRTRFPGYNFACVPTRLIPLPLEGGTIRSLLYNFGPLYVAARTSNFGEPSNHALVLTGIDNTNADEPFVWLLDSSSPEEQNPIRWPLDNLIALLGCFEGWSDITDSGLWRYSGANARTNNR
jgi:hypothetical protein